MLRRLSGAKMGKDIVLTDALNLLQAQVIYSAYLVYEVYETLPQAQLEEWMLKLGPQTLSPLF